MTMVPLPTEKPSYPAAFLIVGVAILAGSLFAFFIRLAGTEPMYLRIAHNLLAGNGLSVQQTAPFHPQMFRMPGYPVFVAAIFSGFGEAKVYVYVAQVGLFALACLLFYLSTLRMVDRTSAALSGVALAAYPGAAYYTGGIISEVLALTVFLALMWTLLRWKDSQSVRPLIVTGLLAGLAALVRPGFALFPAFIFVVDLLRGVRVVRALVRAAVIGAIAVVVVLPWSARNYLVSGSFVPLTTEASQSVYLGSLEVGEYTGKTYADNLRYEPETLQFDLDLLEYGSPQEQVASRRRHWDLAFSHIREAPVQFLAASFIRIFRMWVSMEYRLGEIPSWLVYGAMAMSGGTFILGIFGIWVSRARIRQLAFALVPIVYFPCTHLFFHVESRYTLPARPFLLMFGVLALREAYRRLRCVPELKPLGPASFGGRDL